MMARYSAAQEARVKSLSGLMWGVWMFLLLGSPRASADPPEGIWELAASHRLPIDARVVLGAGGLVVASDLRTAILGVRPDSGLVVWQRKLGAGPHGVQLWRVRGAEDVVLVRGDKLVAYRADVGVRLWEKDLGCREACEVRVVHAGPLDEGRGEAIYLAQGGVVQEAVMRVDPVRGEPMWANAAKVRHPRAVVTGEAFAAFEEGQAPFSVVFVEPATGRELGRWEKVRQVPSSALLVQGGRLVAVELRPEDGGLASVVILRPDGEVLSERHIARPSVVQTEPMLARARGRGLGIWTPDPARGRAFVTSMELEPPWKARTESVATSSAPVDGRGLAFVWGEPWQLVMAGEGGTMILPTAEVGPPRAFAVDGRLVVVERAAKGGGALASIEAGRVSGVGAGAWGEVMGVASVGEQLVLVARDADGAVLHRLGFVSWGEAISKLRAARAAGQDVDEVVTRLARVAPVKEALGDASQEVPEVPEAEPPESAQGGIAAEDIALVGALREAWRRGEAVESLEAMQTLVEQASGERRRTLLGAFAELVLDLVLAPAARLKPDGVLALTALARYAETETRTKPLSRPVLGLYAAAAAILDEPLVGADLLEASMQPEDALISQSRLELARRALHLLRMSAGPLKTDTSREMLVAGLRFFKHLDAVVGEYASEVRAKLEEASISSDATRELVTHLIRAEGDTARLKRPQVATCQLACEATLVVCGDGAVGRVEACRSRCMSQGAVRFSSASRPTEDSRWFCQ
jgi:hypothetical protein